MQGEFGGGGGSPLTMGKNYVLCQAVHLITHSLNYSKTFYFLISLSREILCPFGSKFDHTFLKLSKIIYSIGHKKGAMAKNCPVFQQFLAVVYSVAFDV
jgi:hypothetical protein